MEQYSTNTVVSISSNQHSMDTSTSATNLPPATPMDEEESDAEALRKAALRSLKTVKRKVCSHLYLSHLVPFCNFFFLSSVILKNSASLCKR